MLPRYFRDDGSWQTGLVSLVLGALAICCFGRPLLAAEPSFSVGSTGSASPAMQREAIQALPMEKLDRNAQAKVRHVLEDVTLYRRLPGSVLKADPNFYLFMVNRPDTVVNIWRELGISEIRLSQTGSNSYTADDGHGTNSTMEFLHRSHDMHLVYAEMVYKGPLITGEIEGSCLFFLRSGYVKHPDGEWYITHRLDAFVRLDSLGADLLARTFQGWVGRVADRNFVEVTTFLTRLFQRMKHDRTWTETLVGRLKNLHPQVQQELSALTEKLAQLEPLPPKSLDPPPEIETAVLESDEPTVKPSPSRKIAASEPNGESPRQQ